MVKKATLFFWSLFAACSLLIPLTEAGEYGVSPKTRAGGKWRIGYYEGGPYIDYQHNMRSYIKALMALGWIEPSVLPEDSEDGPPLWDWLADSAKSPYLVFVRDCFFSADWQEEKRDEIRKTAMARLSGQKDVDLMLAMGTWAGQDLANSDHAVPVMVMAAANPLQANIIKSLEDSGFDHVIAKCDPGRYIRQLRLFHDIINFNSIGVVYDDSDAGRVYANLEDVRLVAAERGFDVVECRARETDVSQTEAMKNVLRCWENIAPRIEALWITVHNGEHPKFMPGILAPLFEHRIPTWTRRNSDQVARGVLMSISRKNYDDLGMFYAETTAKIFNGALPGQLEQEFREPLKIAINTEVAKKIGYEIPASVLRVADEVYERIETGPF